tara:strand:+ start:2187 stop:3152 length:966 start_codon:yes stop_codon:yes gene_type:complete
MLSDSLDALEILRDRVEKFQSTAGGQASGLCPFHTETRPSFRINIDPTSERFLSFFCHGCHAKGNGRRLLGHLLGASEQSLVDELLPKFQLARPVLAKKRAERDHHLSEALLGAFSGWSITSLEEKGFHKDVLREFEVGIDDSRDAYTYPIRDYQGSLVGIYMRNRLPGRAKYRPYGPRDLPEGLISPEYTLVKGNHVWNLHRALQEDHNTPVVVVEGFKACMWVKQCLGSRVRVVALMGCSITDAQIGKLTWLGGPYTVLLDNTVAALKSAEEIAHKLRSEGFPAVSASYPSNVAQPDNLSTQELEEIVFECHSLEMQTQ